MWLYFDKNGKMIEKLDHGTPAVAGTTKFEIFAFFEDVDIRTVYSNATIKLRRPDFSGSEYPNLVMKGVQKRFQLSAGESSRKFVNNSYYYGYYFDFGSFNDTEEHEVLLDTPGLWNLSITLLSNDNKFVCGKVNFNVADGISSEDETIIEFDSILETVINSLSSYLPKNSNFFIRSVEHLADIRGDLSSYINVGDIVLVKDDNKLYKVVNDNFDVAEYRLKSASIVSDGEIKTIFDDLIVGVLYNITSHDTLAFKINSNKVVAISKEKIVFYENDADDVGWRETSKFINESEISSKITAAMATKQKKLETTNDSFRSVKVDNSGNVSYGDIGGVTEEQLNLKADKNNSVLTGLTQVKNSLFVECDSAFEPTGFSDTAATYVKFSNDSIYACLIKDSDTENIIGVDFCAVDYEDYSTPATYCLSLPMTNGIIATDVSVAEQISEALAGKVDSLVLSCTLTFAEIFAKVEEDGFDAIFYNEEGEQEIITESFLEESASYEEAFFNGNFNSQANSIDGAAGAAIVYPYVAKINILAGIVQLYDLRQYKTGTNVFVIETDVPDRWVSFEQGALGPTFYKLETTKVDLTNYVTKTANAYNVYATNSSGNQCTLVYTANASSNTVVLRGTSGEIKSNIIKTDKITDLNGTGLLLTTSKVLPTTTTALGDATHTFGNAYLTGSILDANGNKKVVSISSVPADTTLTDEEKATIVGGTFINGDFLGLSNPEFYPAKLVNGYYHGIIIGIDASGNNMIRTYTIDNSDNTIYIEGGNYIGLNSLRIVNNKVIPSYPSSEGTFAYKCVDGTLTWADDGSSGGSGIVETTYAELKALRDAGTLSAGTWYRITDYVATTTYSSTQVSSSPKLFDLIVLAVSNNKLSETQVTATNHEGVTYYGYSGHPSTWKIHYCLDNDTSRFEWADTTNGKGVIYLLIDKSNNEAPYDHINIESSVNGSSYMNTFVYGSGVEKTHNNIIKPHYNTSGKRRLNRIILQGGYNTGCYHNYFAEGCYNIILAAGNGGGYYYNIFNQGCNAIYNKNGQLYNCTFGANCYSITFKGTAGAISFGSANHNITFNSGASHISFGIGCCEITIGYTANTLKFGNHVQYVILFSNESTYMQNIEIKDYTNWLWLKSTGTGSIQNFVFNICNGGSRSSYKTLTVERGNTAVVEYKSSATKEIIIDE